MGTSGSGTVATSACSRKGCDGSRNFCAPCEMTTQHLASNLEDKLRAVPTRPGVYLMKDAAGRVIDVGKAASLRNRVRQYFQDSGHLESPRIRHLMSKISDFEVVSCENEVEALILETNLIKQHRPPYNVRMADDKAFPYVKLTNEPYPKIRMTRKVLRDGASYFGPYPYHEPKLVTRTIRTIRKLFKLRSCNIEITRDLPRPCLDCYIGLCTAPCVAWGATAEQYAGQVRQAAMFLAGKQESLLDDLRQEMTRAAEAMEFERAAQLRDQIQAMEAITERQRTSSVGLEDRDVAAVAQTGDMACVQMFYIRAGRLQGQEHFLLEGTRGLTRAEALGGFLTQYYQEAPSVPREVILQEMLRRRFAMAREEQEKLDRDEPVPVKWSVMPDLILIDGGRGQLNAARDVLFEYNVPIPAIGLAKREELIVTADSVDPIALPRDSHALRLLQRLPDEAHRFANASHQQLRARRS